MEEFTPESLPEAIRALFVVNQYEVDGPFEVNGAEIDLRAKSLSDPFAHPIYIEATTEHVDTAKYGKDSTKFLLIREYEPSAELMLVSSRGFSAPVAERAQRSRVTAITYDELFRRFERFEPYIARMLETSEEAVEMRVLDGVYEEPLFDDRLGKVSATEYLSSWRLDGADKRNWVILTGEYGTGKTALTKVLLYRWLRLYRSDPTQPLPLRIELREFTRQFDARGLVHHFLDNNGLGHVPVDFVMRLISTGKIFLLLDGYDEMAQYLHARERRSCLEALAELGSGNAKGVLTSRPNYFTESEELQIFDALYLSLERSRFYLAREDRLLVEHEKDVDALLEQFMEPHERTLRDLDEHQTEALVGRILTDDNAGRTAVMAILRRVFRSVESGEAQSLGGKPVIISYLLQVVEDLKSEPESAGPEGLSEFQIYKIIIDRLMFRDMRRSPELSPVDRRALLQRLAVMLSKKDHPWITEKDFTDLIGRFFRNKLQVLPTDSRHSQVERYFADLRSSATLTRAGGEAVEGWRFSHNSLREYLVVEHLLAMLDGASSPVEGVPISDAMRIFVESLPWAEKLIVREKLSAFWRRTDVAQEKGVLLSLLWSALLGLYEGPKRVRQCLDAVTSGALNLSGVSIARLALADRDLSVDLEGANFEASSLEGVSFARTNLKHADFARAILDSVSFAGANLEGASFSHGVLVDVDMQGAFLKGASFLGVKADEIVIISAGHHRPRMAGEEALGFLRYSGASTEPVPEGKVMLHHPHYPIVEKIVEKLSEQAKRQRLGLVQRGAAHRDIPVARSFMEHLEREGLIRTPEHRQELVEATEDGKKHFASWRATGTMSKSILAFFERPTVR